MSNRNISVAFDAAFGIFTRVELGRFGWCSYVEVHQKAPKGAPSWFFEECEFEEGDAFEEIVGLPQWHGGLSYSSLGGSPGRFVATFGDDYAHHWDQGVKYTQQDIERDVLVKAKAVRDFIKSLR